MAATMQLPVGDRIWLHFKIIKDLEHALVPKGMKICGQHSMHTSQSVFGPGQNSNTSKIRTPHGSMQEILEKKIDQSKLICTKPGYMYKV